MRFWKALLVVEAHQYNSHVLCDCIWNDAASAEGITSALIHQVVVGLYHVELTGGDKLLDTAGGTIRRKPDKTHFPVRFQF